MPNTIMQTRYSQSCINLKSSINTCLDYTINKYLHTTMSLLTVPKYYSITILVTHNYDYDQLKPC